MKKLSSTTVALIIKAYCKTQGVRLSQKEIQRIVTQASPQMTQSELLELIKKEDKGSVEL